MLAVLTEAGYRCAVPTCRTILAIDLHHIIEVSQNGTNNPDNLIALCPTCHALYHRGIIHKESISRWKDVLVAQNKPIDRHAGDKEDNKAEIGSNSEQSGPKLQVLFVETRLILPQHPGDQLRVELGLMNRGTTEANVTLYDRTYYLSATPTQRQFKYLSTSPESILIPPIPNAIWRLEMRFDVNWTSLHIAALNAGKVRLFVFARGHVNGPRENSTPLPFSGMYDPHIQGNLISCPRDVTFV